MGKILNKCQICGSRVQVSILMQYTGKWVANIKYCPKRMESD